MQIIADRKRRLHTVAVSTGITYNENNSHSNRCLISVPEHGAQEAILAATEPVRHQQIDTLYLSHHGWLQGWLRRKLGDAADAADLAHDTFVRLIASTRAINLDDEPRAFLTHIAKGLVVDHWRRHAVERAYLDAIAHLPEPEAPSPEARLLIIESLLRIESMLDSLPANTREIFLLAQLEHLTLQEISTRVGAPVITVRRHIHKALVACMAVA